MKFVSNDISISDSEYGCQICFSDEVDNGNKSQNNNSDSLGNYILLQRTYPEDDFDKDYSYIEFSDFGKSGALKNYKMNLYRNRLLIYYKNENIEILFDVKDSKYQKIKKVMQNITTQNGELIIHD